MWIWLDRVDARLMSLEYLICQRVQDISVELVTHAPQTSKNYGLKEDVVRAHRRRGV